MDEKRRESTSEIIRILSEYHSSWQKLTEQMMKIHLTWTQSKVLLFSFHRPDVAHHQLEPISEEVLEFAGPREDLIQASKGATREACALPAAHNCLWHRLLTFDNPAAPSRRKGSRTPHPPSPPFPVPTQRRPASSQLSSADWVPARERGGIADEHQAVRWQPRSQLPAGCLFDSSTHIR